MSSPNNTTPAPQEASAPPIPESALPIVDFQIPQKHILPCTYCKCTSGHLWPTVLRISECPGCRGPILTMLMAQCPVCNEPVAETLIRIDHLPQGGQLLPLCKGSATLAEVKQIIIKHTHARDEQDAKAERVMVSKPHNCNAATLHAE